MRRDAVAFATLLVCGAGVRLFALTRATGDTEILQIIPLGILRTNAACDGEMF